MKNMRYLISGIVIGCLLISTVLAKQERPELWEEVYNEGNVTWSVEINHIVYCARYNCYMFLTREYNSKKGYRIYSCIWWPDINSFSYPLRWIGSEYTDKRAALPVEPKYFFNNVKGNRVNGDKLPLKPWQEAVTTYVVSEVALHSNFVIFVDDIQKAPLLPNYPYNDGLRR